MTIRTSFSFCAGFDFRGLHDLRNKGRCHGSEQGAVVELKGDFGSDLQVSGIGAGVYDKVVAAGG